MVATTALARILIQTLSFADIGKGPHWLHKGPGQMFTTSFSGAATGE